MPSKKDKDSGPKVPATIQNRRASHEYHFDETIEAGLVLVGSEVKSLYGGRASLSDAYCVIKNGELWLISCDIEPYKHASHFQPERRRDRKLLVHKYQITQLRKASEEKGKTLIPYKIYFSKGKAKVAIAIATGKKLYDKRQSLKEKDQRREWRKGQE